MKCECMSSTISIETPRKNKYLFDQLEKITLLSHPVMYFLVCLKKEGTDLEKWIPRLDRDKEIMIDDYGPVSFPDILYYKSKLDLLEQNGFFKPVAPGWISFSSLSAGDIENAISNIKQITLEVTDSCNLNCEYCGYGKFYTNAAGRSNKNLDPASVKTLLIYLKQFLDSPLNQSLDRTVFLSFYGGEPLLNFSLIEETVQYAKQMDLKRAHFRFSITTNAVLLDKYMDFLVMENFTVYISLDGNEINQSYRVYHNGRPSFQNIIDNILLLREKYPGFFKENVQFNSVLHNRNSVQEIYDFFKNRFDKTPRILALNTYGIKEEFKDKFRNTYKNPKESLLESNDYSKIEEEMFIRLGNIQEHATFVFQSTNFCFMNYKDLLAPVPKKVIRPYPTGTCIPFSQKLFVTAKGDILSCERISQEFVLGHVSLETVSLDFESIAQKYNHWFDLIREQCSRCSLAATCTQCLFFLIHSQQYPAKKVVCPLSKNPSLFARSFAESIDYFEKNPSMYDKILKEVHIES